MDCVKGHFKSPDEILEQKLLNGTTSLEKWAPCIKASEGIPCGPDGKGKDGKNVAVDSQKGNFECGCQNVAVDTKTLPNVPKSSWKPGVIKMAPSTPGSMVSKATPSRVSMATPSEVSMAKPPLIEVDEQITDLVGFLKSRPDLFRKRNTSDPQTIQQINKVFDKIRESYSNYTAMGKKNGNKPFLTYDRVLENLQMLGRRTDLSAVANFYSDSVLSVGIVLTNALFIRQYGYQPTKSFYRDYAMPRVNPNGNTNLSIQMNNSLADIFYFQDGHVMSGAGKPTVSSEDRALVSGLLC